MLAVMHPVDENPLDTVRALSKGLPPTSFEAPM